MTWNELLVLPIRYGGLGLTNPTKAMTEHDNFILITAKLTDQIYNQNLHLEYNSSDQPSTRIMKSKL